jgi:flavin-dependent thymidylate synthase
MHHAVPDTLAAAGHDVEPQVTLISMTRDPLRVMAAASDLYRGEPRHSPDEISQAMAERWLNEMGWTALQTPLEFIDVHLFFEGVTRAFTHQLVRQRVGASYVQESLRFAVKDNAVIETRMPPSIAKLKNDDPKRVTWLDAVAKVSWAYNALIADGIPAEDARGLLPTNITTRVHYKTTLRGLAQHSEVRLCSQAQYEWKEVWRGIINAILAYGPEEERWQQREITKLFRPICYRTGKCEFMGSNDRWCAIRERVEAHHRKGEGSDVWNRDIDPMDALREGAARLSPEMGQMS